MISSTYFDCAYVAVPHYQSAAIVREILASEIHVLKEKPAAMNAVELESLQELARSNAVTLSTAGQFRYGEQFRQIQQWLPLIGQIRFVEGAQKIAVRDLGDGWRASKMLSGGGVLIDLGWHLVDLVLSLLGDSIPAVEFSQTFKTRPFKLYDCEDTARATFLIYNSKLAANNIPISCGIFVTRLGPTKTFQLIIYGESGSLRRDGDIVELNLAHESEIKDFVTSPSAFQQMVSAFHTKATGQASVTEYLSSMCRDMMTMQTIDNIYDAARKTEHLNICHGSPMNSSNAHSAPDCKYNRPLIDGQITDAVEKQLQENVSIYDNGGIFGEFESARKKLHGLTVSFALLHNSGTNALQALYCAAQLQPGDEVVFPVYTFHATSSPAMQFGIIPIFCDALENGNISPKAISSAITPRRKAVVVTHMWGMPCNMRAICGVLKNHPAVLLFDDCSHAHGAKIDGQLVGTFGDAAAWSLQGQKIISGGEGGATLTKHAEFYYRQLLWGHYNKRRKAEIPSDHPLSSFSLTGAGNKNRAHPLAVRIAFTQLQHLESILRFKKLFALQMVSRLAKIPFLKVPSVVALGLAQMEPAWYALVLRFVGSQAPNGLTRESYVRELHERGLCEIDIPKSTGLLHREPLYTSPEKIFPHLYPDGISRGLGRNEHFPIARVSMMKLSSCLFGRLKTTKQSLIITSMLCAKLLRE